MGRKKAYKKRKTTLKTSTADYDNRMVGYHTNPACPFCDSGLTTKTARDPLNNKAFFRCKVCDHKWDVTYGDVK